MFDRSVEVPRTTELEPDFAARQGDWEAVFAEPFLLKDASHPILRAFFVPGLSPARVATSPYVLLKRRPPA